eukprot:TRINITY_DN3068_c0_g1_i6.p1 TRINITY_DN3068_c0_g1~~TRINITY_DN3068_c0_g1_i6.p1  ORF type:complete len:486 (+),score=118.46 TRINITY_DN3068_c0_g1_i6:88-1458(+)
MELRIVAGKGVTATVWSATSRSYGRSGDCFHCGEYDHLSRDCPTRPPPRNDKPCFKCGRVGHLARDCFQAKTGSTQSNPPGGKVSRPPKQQESNVNAKSTKPGTQSMPKAVEKKDTDKESVPHQQSSQQQTTQQSSLDQNLNNDSDQDLEPVPEPEPQPEVQPEPQPEEDEFYPLPPIPPVVFQEVSIQTFKINLVKPIGPIRGKRTFVEIDGILYVRLTPEEPEPEPEPVLEPEPESRPEQESESQQEQEPESQPEPEPESQPETEDQSLETFQDLTNKQERLGKKQVRKKQPQAPRQRQNKSKFEKQGKRRGTSVITDLYAGLEELEFDIILPNAPQSVEEEVVVQDQVGLVETPQENHVDEKNHLQGLEESPEIHEDLTMKVVEEELVDGVPVWFINLQAEISEIKNPTPVRKPKKELSPPVENNSHQRNSITHGKGQNGTGRGRAKGNRGKK